MSGNENSDSQFLNVDLDIYHQGSAYALAQTLEADMIVLSNSSNILSLEMKESYDDINATINAMTNLISNLPEELKQVWFECDARQFNIGISASRMTGQWVFPVFAEVISSIAKLNAELAITIYRHDENV